MNKSDTPNYTPFSQAEVLSKALPYMQRYDGETIVVKYGGHAMGNAELSRSFARNITLLKQSGVKPVVVHGGGPQIGQMLDRLGIESKFSDGLRITDDATIRIVEMVLAGSINKDIVASINHEGGRAVGLCGKDGNLLLAKKITRKTIDPTSKIEQIVDLGFVGEPEKVDTTIIDILSQSSLIPVIAPVALGKDGETYNVNADSCASAIASALNAKRLLFLTDVAGVLDKSGNLIENLTISEAKGLIADGTINGGMIPKVENCIQAIENGVSGVVIVNGKVEHAVLLELFTEHGAGTLIKSD